MPCVPVKIGDSTGLLCSRGQRPKPCFYCGKPSEYLCDFPVGKTKKGKVKTCDAPLCSDCVRHSVTEGVDFCQPHYAPAKAAYERRMARERKQNLFEK